jgi:uncharacterized coiled-coil DUF342 family protein
MEEETHPTVAQWMKPLRSEDYALLAQENKEYRQLIATMQQREALMEGKVAKLQRTVDRLRNEAEEYRVRWEELNRRSEQQEAIRQELKKEYSQLKQAVENQPTNQTNQTNPTSALLFTLEGRLAELVE